MDRESFMFYKSYRDAGEMIPENKRLKFYEMIFDFGLTGEEPEDTGDALIDMALKFIRPLIKANIQNYLNGCKGGVPKGTVNNPKGKNQYEDNRRITENKPKDNRRITDGKGNVKDKDKAKENDKETEKDNDKVNDNVNVNVKDKEKEKEEPAAPSHFETEEERKAREEREADEWWESLGDDRQ